MPPNSESPVQTQLPIPVPNRVLGKGSNIISRRHVGSRRVFVQTDTGSVLGLDLDRADNAQTVKKKMQSMLKVPTEQSALVFGGTVLENDLSELRNDSPVLLTRGLQRSVSTPCFSPSPESRMHMDQSQPLEVVGGLRCSKIKLMIKEMVKAMECGVEPISVNGGLGGAYYFRNMKGESIAIVKPTDEEPFAPNNPKGLVGKMLGQPGLKRAVRIGETGIREVAAYLLDHEHFARVPPTVLIKVKHRIFHVNNATSIHKDHSKPLAVAKIASCQEFVPHDFDASEHGASHFSVCAVHRIGILDVRIFNTDRHGGNILIKAISGKDKQRQWGQSVMQLNELLELIPIDHGLCLPETFEDPYFEWLHWPQASFPFSDEELEYISRLDAVKDVQMLRVELPMLREACLRMLILCTTFLKITAAAGLCLADIGGMMSRDSALEEASEFELLCLQAKHEVDQELSFMKSTNSELVSEFCTPEELPGEQFQFYMDQDDDYPISKKVDAPIASHCKEAGEGLQCKLPVGNCFVSIHRPIMSVAASPVIQRWPCILGSSTLNPKRSSQPLSCIPSAHTRGSSQACGNPCMPFKIHPVKEEEEHSLGLECLEVDKEIVSPFRTQSLKSLSFSYGRQRCSNHLLFRKAFNRQGISVSETRGKTCAVPSMKSLVFADMTEEEWMMFMGFFEELLREALENWKSKRPSHKQRLGVSCQF